MRKHKNDEAVQFFDHLTEALRRGRRRIRQEYVPELCAWLLLHANRYERHYNRYKELDGKSKDPQILHTIRHIKTACQVIEVLINELCDGFDGFEWVDSTNTVGSILGISPGEPIPPHLDTDGKIPVPLTER